MAWAWSLARELLRGGPGGCSPPARHCLISKPLTAGRVLPGSWTLASPVLVGVVDLDQSIPKSPPGFLGVLADSSLQILPMPLAPVSGVGAQPGRPWTEQALQLLRHPPAAAEGSVAPGTPADGSLVWEATSQAFLPARTSGLSWAEVQGSFLPLPPS